MQDLRNSFIVKVEIWFIGDLYHKYPGHNNIEFKTEPIRYNCPNR